MAGSEHEAEHAAQRRRFALLRREWQLSLYPQAAEAGGCLVTTRSGESAERDADPERAATEANRRARAKIRRYGVANRLNRHATLTYAGEGCFDPVQLRQDVAAFFKALRPALGGQALPYVWVPEWHPGGHGLHVHFIVGRYVRQSLIREAWGHGIVHIKLIGDLPGRLGRARGSAASGWLSVQVHRQGARRRAPHGWSAPLRGRAGLPARADPRLRGDGRRRDRARIRVHGASTGDDLALVERGGVAWASYLLGCLG